MRIKILILVLMVGMSTGCKTVPQASVEAKPTSSEFMKNYFTQIKKYDGIDEREAILLAQSQLRFQGDEKKYYIDHPQVVPYDEEHWLVSFAPVNKTLAQVSSNPDLLIIIDKKNGDVRTHKESFR